MPLSCPIHRGHQTFIFVALVLLVAGACSEEGSPAAESLMPDSADQVAYGFLNHFTVDGVERAQLEADSAYHYADHEEWELFNLRVEFRSPQGVLRSTLTSLRGTYNWSTDNMEARDSVVAVTPDNRRLTTCAIEYKKDSDIITGPCAFVFDAENEHLEGESFTADPDFRNVTAVRPSSGTVRDPNALPGN
jgi:LPS export ABC transporter protein LptC